MQELYHQSARAILWDIYGGDPYYDPENMIDRGDQKTSQDCDRLTTYVREIRRRAFKVVLEAEKGDKGTRIPGSVVAYMGLYLDKLEERINEKSKLEEADKKYFDKNIERETDGNMQGEEVIKPKKSKHISIGEELPPELL